LDQWQECNPHCSGVCRTKKELRWAKLLGRGYWVSAVGKDEAAVRRYPQEQEQKDKRLEQMNLMAL